LFCKIAEKNGSLQVFSPSSDFTAKLVIACVRYLRRIHKNIYADKSNEAIVKTLKQQLKLLIVQYKDDEALKLFESPI